MALSLAPLKRQATRCRPSLETSGRRVELEESHRGEDLDAGEGPEAEKVLRMIEEAGRLEHVTDIAQQRFVRRTLELEDSLKPLDIMLWLKVSQEIGNTANNAERVADKLRLLISK